MLGFIKSSFEDKYKVTKDIIKEKEDYLKEINLLFEKRFISIIENDLLMKENSTKKKVLKYFETDNKTILECKSHKEFLIKIIDIRKNGIIF